MHGVKSQCRRLFLDSFYSCVNFHVVCPLCHSKSISEYLSLSKAYYSICDICSLIYLDAQFFMKPKAERHRYAQHNNTIENSGYVNFFKPLIKELNSRLTSPSIGLDYGCGPGPVLSELLIKQGYVVDVFDPFFFPNCKFKEEYNFILCTEAMEHFFYPKVEFEKMAKLLKNKESSLYLMTEIWQKKSKLEFERWYYRRDPSHVCFYQEETILYLADTFFNKKKVDIFGKNLIVIS